MSSLDSAIGKNVRVRVTCLGTSVLRTITREASLGASLMGLMPAEDLRQMFPVGSSVEVNFLNRGEIHLRAEGEVDATLGTNKMCPGETHVLCRDDVQTLAIGPHVLKLQVFSSHF